MLCLAGSVLACLMVIFLYSRFTMVINIQLNSVDFGLKIGYN